MDKNAFRRSQRLNREMLFREKLVVRCLAMKYLLTIVVIGLLICGALGDAEEEVAEGPSHETAVSDLPQLLETDEGIEQLYEEFASIEGGQRRPWTVAESPENIKKNRYDDLLAFDHSRVILNPLPDDPNSDYINANYIDGQNSEKEYVGTQGPLPNTINDFWRMIWQLNATKIVMLANIIEHGKTKVEKYWPDNSATYGAIEVTKLMEHSIPRLQHVIRTFSVKRSGIVQPRLVRQFHFTGWPDLGVPKDRFPVISIIRQARLYNPESEAPLVIHCSAGIGRTGTIILMDSMVQRAKAEGVVDFPKRLDHMRTLRPDVVEKKEQYVFAHQAVNEVFNDPETKEKLEEVEEEYRLMDSQMDIKDIASPKDFRQALQRMMWQNTVMRILISSLLEQSDLLNNKEHNNAVEV